MQCLKVADQQILLSQVQLAHTFWSRLCGLLPRKHLEPEQGLLIRPCNSVHTLGMKFPIGVVFLTHEGKICHLIAHMPPGKLSPLIGQAYQVLELHPETLAQANLQVGDSLQFTD